MSSLAVPESPPRMSFEEFLAWTDEDTRAEWVDGEVVLLMTATQWHQRLAFFLATVIRLYVEAHQLGEVFIPPFLMKTGPYLPGREPDVIYLSPERLNQLRAKLIEGPADLVIEVVSEDSERRDHRDKLQEYEQGGVREYWLIDSEGKRPEFFQRDENGVYHAALPDENGRYHSRTIPGLWVDLRWLEVGAQPTALAVAREWGLI